MRDDVKLIVRFCLLVALSIAVLAIVLAIAVTWGPHRCDLQFPKIMGCAVGAYEGLTSGIIAASAALIAGWLAWSAVQHQIEAEERRAAADRLEVERLFSDDLDWMAEGLTGIWRVVDKIERSETNAGTKEEMDAIVYGLGILAKPSRIATARKMAECLGWERRRKYEDVFESLERMAGKICGDQTDWFDARRAIHNLAGDLETACPECGAYFEGFWRHSPKAWSLGYAVEVMAGHHDKTGGTQS